jgi:glycosyltransferase involved in cell wall biosynthesis
MNYETLKDLHESGKYEVAELASYIDDNYPKINDVPWKVYPVIPSPEKVDEKAKYNADPTWQFGAGRLNDVLLDFQPDIVFSYRDFWHDEFITKTPYRNLFQYVWSACVDSEPPAKHWIDRWSTVDLLTSYTDWGLGVLNTYGGSRLNIADTNTMPGIDTTQFCPAADKEALRDKMGLSNDVNIILTVMRNQPRKLFPDIIRTFMHYIHDLYKEGRSEEADKTFLYLHTSHPDVGFDIPMEIQRYNAGHKILVTYICDNPECKHSFPSFCQGEHTYCPKCHKLSAHMPNPGAGVTRDQLADIYRIADLYIQYSVAGALEIPIIEAKSAGIPVIVADYAAPYELNRMGGSAGEVKILGFKQEGVGNETGQLRAVPDNDHLRKLIKKFFMHSPEKRAEMGVKARETAVKYHDAKLSSQKWMDIFDQMPMYPMDRWTQEPRIINIKHENIPYQLPDTAFVRWCVRSLLPAKHYCATYVYEKTLLKWLTMGYYVDAKGTIQQCNKQSIVEILNHEAQQYNHMELHRYNMLVTKPQQVDLTPHRIY